MAAVAILVVVLSAFVIMEMTEALSELGMAVSRFVLVDNCAEAVEDSSFQGFMDPKAVRLLLYLMAGENGIEFRETTFFNGTKDRIVTIPCCEIL